jgi:uncharacterized protein
MSPDLLSSDERSLLLKLARQALEAGVLGQLPPLLDPKTLPPNLQQPGASFVTLTRFGDLRGCVGTLEPYQPLAQDVQEHAIAAALQDYRFPPVQPSELPNIKIEVSRLTLPRDLGYSSPEDLVSQLRPGIDGVTLIDGRMRATFLPQVWEKLHDPQTFLNHLCRKMGAPDDLWRKRTLRVQTYQVEEFHE